jgi:hypothetical protein
MLVERRWNLDAARGGALHSKTDLVTPVQPAGIDELVLQVGLRVA